MLLGPLACQISLLKVDTYYLYHGYYDQGHVTNPLFESLSLFTRRAVLCPTSGLFPSTVLACS